MIMMKEKVWLVLFATMPVLSTIAWYSIIPYLISYLILKKRKLESRNIAMQAFVFIILGWLIFALLGLIGYTYVCSIAEAEYVSDNARILPIICIMCTYFFIFYYAIPLLAEKLDIVLLLKTLKFKIVKYISSKKEYIE